MHNRVQLNKYNNSWYQPGNPLKRFLWYFVNVFILKNALNPSSKSRVLALQCFGAKIGKGVIIKPGVSIKYPWKLKIGDYCWIGENVWIDNLDQVTLHNHVCISQGAMLLCGNHNYKKTTFDLMIAPITLEDGAWVGAQAIVSPGVTIKSHAILAVGSIASKDLAPYSIYKGNPATKIKERFIE